MNKTSKLFLIIIVILAVALSVMTYKYFEMKNVAKNNLNNFLEQAELLSQLNKELNEYQENEDLNDNMKETIKAVVVKVNENSAWIMEIGDREELYRIGVKNIKDVELENNQEILVYYDGSVMETYPAQIGNIGKIEVIKEKSETQVPDDIVRFCYNSKDNVKVNIMELSNKGIILSVIDKNVLPYNYSHSYKINKKVKNPNYTGVGQVIGENTENSTAGFTRNRTRVHMGRGR